MDLGMAGVCLGAAKALIRPGPMAPPRAGRLSYPDWVTPQRLNVAAGPLAGNFGERRSFAPDQALAGSHLPALVHTSMAFWVKASIDMRASGVSLLISWSTLRMSLIGPTGPFL